MLVKCLRDADQHLHHFALTLHSFTCASTERALISAYATEQNQQLIATVVLVWAWCDQTSNFLLGNPNIYSEISSVEFRWAFPGKRLMCSRQISKHILENNWAILPLKKLYSLGALYTIAPFIFQLLVTLVKESAKLYNKESNLHSF